MTDSRAKGARCEREFAAMCFDNLGVSCKRNLEQSRSGGHDIDGINGWAPEIKARSNTPSRSELDGMWAQTIDQAERANAKPLLAVKVNRRGWLCYIDAADFRGDIFERRQSRVSLEPKDLFQLIRALAYEDGIQMGTNTEV